MEPVWEIFDFAWGDPAEVRNTGGGESSGSGGLLLALEDGEISNDDDDDGQSRENNLPDMNLYSPSALQSDDEADDSVPTTQPEQTAEEDPIEISMIDGIPADEYKKFAEKYPTLAKHNPDGTQPPDLSPPRTKMMELPDEAPASSVVPSMGPPAPPGPDRIKQKQEVQKKLDELRWDPKTSWMGRFYCKCHLHTTWFWGLSERNLVGPFCFSWFPIFN